MAWPGKQAWLNRRLKREREALAASVEEVAGQEELDFPDEEAEDESEREVRDSAHYVSIIPPQIHLQSRVWPVVRPSQLMQAVPEASQRMDEAYAVPQGTVQNKRLAGRSTRVHLQAVRVEPSQRITTEQVHSVDARPQTGETEPHRFSELTESHQDRQHEREQFVLPVPSPVVYGSGIFKQGEGQTTVLQGQITAQSVVTIMLAGNPGPVVVQYITLHPDVGFTIHLSAPTSASAPFNYLIWLGSAAVMSGNHQGP